MIVKLYRLGARAPEIIEVAHAVVEFDGQRYSLSAEGDGLAVRTDGPCVVSPEANNAVVVHDTVVYSQAQKGR